MTTTRKKIITVETRQKTVIRQSLRRTFWCEFCAEQVECLSLVQIAEASGVFSHEVYSRIENGSLHFIEFKNDSLYICLNSLKTNK